jgi:hypothetical protein
MEKGYWIGIEPHEVLQRVDCDFVIVRVENEWMSWIIISSNEIGFCLLVIIRWKFIIRDMNAWTEQVLDWYGFWIKSGQELN